MLFFYFSFGGVCGILFDKPSRYNSIKKIKYLIMLLSVIYFTTSIFENNFNIILYHLFSFLLFGLLILALALEPIKISQNRALNYLGKISYGIYMYHTIIILQFVGLLYLKLISKLNFNNTIDIVIINSLVFILTILISHWSYKYYEGYFFNLKQKIRSNKRNFFNSNINSEITSHDF